MRQMLRALVGVMVFMGSWGPGWAADSATLQPPEIEALQRRLSDAQCYAGEIDGIDSPELNDDAKACPSQDPVLRIEAGMHTAPIGRVGIDAACKLMATGSDDETVRLWSLPEGRLVRTVRLPVGDGNGSRTLAVALSPDGRMLAAGAGRGLGQDADKGQSLYVGELAEGGVRRLGAFDQAIERLAFSKDGQRIGVALAAGGVRVLDRSGRELMADRDYGDAALGLAFGPDGAVFTTSTDGFLRRYGADLKLAAKVKAPGGLRPFAVAVEPAGKRVAVGYDGAPAVSILDALTLKPLAAAETTDVGAEDLAQVGWSADGKQLVAGGRAQKAFGGALKTVLRRFSPTGKHVGADVAAADGAITDVVPCGGGIAFATADPSFGLITADGQVRTLEGPVAADMRGKTGAALGVAADATSVRFGLGSGEDRPALFNLPAGTLRDAPQFLPGLLRAATDSLPVVDWNASPVPKFRGLPIALDPGDVSRALAIRIDRGGFAIGTDRSLRAIDARGKERWTKAVPGPTAGLAFDGDGRIVVAAYRDGTIRWHRWSDGQELLTLFVHAPSRRWVAWTPTGYYMASLDGADLIGWRLNRGWDEEADFFPASRFRDRLNRPDIVQKVLQTLDEGDAVRQANAAAKRANDRQTIAETLPPVIRVLAPAEGAAEPPGPVEIRYSTRLPSGGQLDRIDVLLDGAKLDAHGSPSAAADGSGTVVVPMPAHDASVSLVAYAGGHASDPARIELKSPPVPVVRPAPAGSPAADADAGKPVLYALTVGVSRYENQDLDLDYAATDASDLATVLKAQKGRLYKDVVTKVLLNEEATSTAVKQGLIWLHKVMTARDVAVLFVAGHGTTDPKGRFWFLTTDADPEQLLVSAVSGADIADVLNDMPGRKLMILDACRSGTVAARTLNACGADLTAAVADFAQPEGGVVTIAASTGTEFAFERDDWGHGAFTKALMDALADKADPTHKGTVTTATLDAFLIDRVEKMTGGRQHPIMARPKTVPDFPLATAP